MGDSLAELAAELRRQIEALASQEDVSAMRSELDGLKDQFTAEKVGEMIRVYLESLGEGDETELAKVRKLVFAREGDPHLTGSKYGRLGLSLSDLEMAHDILESAQRVGLSRGPSEDLRGAVKALSERVAMPDGLARSDDERRLEEQFRKGILDVPGFLRAQKALEQVYGRAMDTAESGFGLQLIGTQYVSDLWEGARARSRVFALINTFAMTDPTAQLPVEAALPELLFVAESVDTTSADYATSKTASQRVQVDAKKFVIHQVWTGELEEDSIIPFIPFLRDQAARSIASHSDSLALNGDNTTAATGNINLDDAAPAATKHYLAFDGIRHAALVDNTGNGKDLAGPITFNELISAKGLMLDVAREHDWGHPDSEADLVYVCDPETADRIAVLDEVTTVDKFGERATVLTGQQGRVGMHPLISSVRVSKTEADGKVSTTGANNTKGQVVVFNRGGFVWGWRRQLKVETERIPAKDQSRIVYSLRAGFGRYTPTGAAAGIEGAAVLYNITL
ncbi:MAG: phage major capsid protein [Actinomycetota bacterium]